MKKPVTIVGGGLAGLSLGIGLRRAGIPVRLHEAGSYPRHRVCGEFICGVSEAVLQSLGIEDVLDESLPNRSTAWFRKDREILRQDLPFPASGISRFALDAELAQRFEEAGGELLTGDRFRAESNSEKNGIVFASGRPRKSDSQWIGLKCHLREFSPEADLEMHLGRDGYIGLSRVENGIVNACGLFRIRPNISAKREQLLPAYLDSCELSELADRIRSAQADPDSAVGVNAFQFGRQGPAKGKPTQFSIGDQYAIIGPFTGNGMSMAFESAALALPAVQAWSEGEIDWDTAMARYDHDARRRFRGRMRLSGMLHPFLMNPTGQSLLSGLASANLLPFSSLFHALR